MAAIYVRDPSHVIRRTVDRLLHAYGLERRDRARSALTAVSLFGAGIIMGAATSLAFAPKSGQELRQDLARRLAQARQGLRSSIQSAGREQRYTPPS